LSLTQELGKRGRFAKVYFWRHSQVVRQRSAKPLFTSSNLVAASSDNKETFEKCIFLFEFKEGENFNHPSTICRSYGAGRNTLSISRIKI
jgi:hypothetical protein